MVFEGMDPATDFRGGGFLSLQCLCDLYRLDSDLFRRLMFKTEGKRTLWEYPFAIAGVNITFTLIDMLHLRKEKASPANNAIRGFLKLLENEDETFALVYCIMFELLDQIWLDRQASYMEFQNVLK